MDKPAILMNEMYDDCYFDVVNALDEAQQIHFKHSGLQERLAAAAAEDRPFVIGETGFGAGRLVVALLEYLRQNTVENLQIIYNTVELHPISTERMRDILGTFQKRVGEEIASLLAVYDAFDTSRPGWHTAKLAFPNGQLTLNLWVGEAIEMVNALEAPCEVWFLDGHSPKKNPSIWRMELLQAIGLKTVEGGACTTFTVAVAVRGALQAAGFSLKILPGCGGKKESLLGIRAVARRMLRHIVLFQYQDAVTTAQQQHISDSFAELQNQIPIMMDFEWGINNSPEGKNHAFTHCYQMTFHSEKDRDSYLVHPAHDAFKQILKGHIAGALVVDYWTNTEKS